jgi:hypothetical protein
MAAETVVIIVVSTRHMSAMGITSATETTAERTAVSVPRNHHSRAMNSSTKGIIGAPIAAPTHATAAVAVKPTRKFAARA